MILPDINLLIYAHNQEAAQHAEAKAWLLGLLNGPIPVCFCWETINGFIRISTNARAMQRPLTLEQAFLIVRTWLDSPSAVLLEKTARHMDILFKVSTESDTRGARFSDAVLAALAIEHNATFATGDSDFDRFAGLAVIDPLSGSER